MKEIFWCGSSFEDIAIDAQFVGSIDVFVSVIITKYDDGRLGMSVGVVLLEEADTVKNRHAQIKQNDVWLFFCFTQNIQRFLTVKGSKNSVVSAGEYGAIRVIERLIVFDDKNSGGV